MKKASPRFKEKGGNQRIKLSTTSQHSDKVTAYVSYRRVLEKDSTEPPLPDPYSTELLLPHCGSQTTLYPSLLGLYHQAGSALPPSFDLEDLGVINNLSAKKKIIIIIN